MNLTENQFLPFLPAPDIIPTYTANTDRDYKRYLNNCLYHYIFIWSNDNEGFWMFPTTIEHNYLLGYQYSNKKWKMNKIHLEHIDNFYN